MVVTRPFREEDGGSDAALKQHLGISADAIIEAVGQSNTERRLCSAHSARSAFGYYSYNGMVTGLTLQLRSYGYGRIDLGGVLPLLVNNERAVKIGVSSGTAMTGALVSKNPPKSRYPKGELVRQMVERNHQSDATPLFDISMETEIERDPIADHELWLVLFYFDKAKAEIRCEVSRPVEVSSRGIISAWYPRIILPPYLVTDFTDEGPEDDFGDGDVDVPVEPR